MKPENKFSTRQLWSRISCCLHRRFTKSFGAKLQNTPQLWFASLTCVGRLWRSRHNTIDAILIQWHANEWPGILKLLPRCVCFCSVFPVPNFFRISWITRHHIKWTKSKYIHDFEKITLNNYQTKKKKRKRKENTLHHFPEWFICWRFKSL